MNERHQRIALWSGMVALAALAAWLAADRALWPWMVAACLGWGALLAVSVSRVAPRAATILLVAVAMRIAWVGLAPTLSDDSYRYAWDGSLVADGINPYSFTPEDAILVSRRDDTIYSRLNSKEVHSVYPPLSQYAFALASITTGSAFPASFYAFKGLVVLLELIALWILVGMVGPRAAMLFAWSPVAVIASAGQAHNDVLLALPLVLAVWAAHRRYWGAAGALLAAGSLVKIWPVLAVPALLRRPRALAAGLIVGFGVVMPLWAPGVVGNVLESLDLYVRSFEFNAGLYYGLKEVLRVATGEDWSKQLGPFLRQVLLLVSLGAGVTAWRRQWSLEKLLLVVYAAVLILSTTVHPWYLYPALLLVALNGRTDVSWLWLSTLSIGTYLLYTGGPYWVFVWLAWMGFFILVGRDYAPDVVSYFLRRRAIWKAEWVAAFLPGGDAGEVGGSSGPILDVGGAEGSVAARLREVTGREVLVADVRGSGAPSPSRLVFDGLRLPLGSGEVSGAMVVFVLHHASQPAALLLDIGRVVDGPIVVIESVVTGSVQRKALKIADRLANGLRQAVERRLERRVKRRAERGANGPETGVKRTTPPGEARDPHFRTPREWRELFEDCGFRVTAEAARYNPLHPKHLFVLSKALRLDA